MNYADINKQYTATVAGYLAKGYTINTRSMCGSQGDYAHIDLTDGTEVIRIMVDTFHRRKELRSIIDQLEELRDALETLKEEEEEYMENMPENLQSSEKYEAAEEAVSNLGDALSSLEDAASSIEEAIGE